MAQRQPKTRPVHDLMEPPGEWPGEPFTPVTLDTDLRAAVRRAAATEERLVVRGGDEELAAIIPMADMRLLLRLEEAELDRIDIEEARRALADPDNQERIPLAQLRAELKR